MLPEQKMIVPDFENVCTDSYLVHDFFDFSYAVLSQLKPDYYPKKVFFWFFVRELKST